MKRISRDDWPICDKTARGLVGFEGYNEGIARRQIPPPESSIDREQASLDRGEAFETVHPAILKEALEAGRIVQLGRRFDEKLAREDVVTDLDRKLPRHDSSIVDGLTGSYVLALHGLGFAEWKHGYTPVQRLRNDIAQVVGLPQETLAADAVVAALAKRHHVVWLDAIWLRAGGISFATEDLRLPQKLPPILVWSKAASAKERAARQEKLRMLLGGVSVS